jgi:hypothetical protein
MSSETFERSAVIFRQNHELLKEIQNLVVKSCKVIYWHDGNSPPPKPLRGGSCFVLRFPHRLVGVTARHVVQAYREAKLQTATLVCQLWNIHFDITERIIDEDKTLDIATFDISEQELGSVGGYEIDCQDAWPPPNPIKGSIISVAGFPELEREAYGRNSANFRSYVGMTVVDDITDRQIITTYDPERDHDLSGVAGLPPLGMNLSGCSGGPVLMHSDNRGIYRWYAVGLIAAGPKCSSGDTSGQDYIFIRRIHYLCEDGKLTGTGGWLPD